MKKSLVGRVISNKMNKTVTVEVSRLEKESSTGKYVRRRTRCVAHDESQVANHNDIVEIISSRPISKRKCWTLIRVVEAAVK